MNNRPHLRRSHTADMPTLSPIAAVQLQLCISSVGTLQASEMASTTGRACCYTSGAPVVKLYTRQYCHLVYTRQAQGLQERTSNLHAGVKRSTQPQPCVKPCRGDQCKIPQLPKHADAQAGMCFVVCCAKQKERKSNQLSRPLLAAYHACCVAQQQQQGNRRPPASRPLPECDRES